MDVKKEKRRLKDGIEERRLERGSEGNMISISLVGYRLLMSRKMNMNYDRENWELLQHKILCPRGLQTDGRRSRLKSCMGLGEAVGLLVHTDLTAAGHDIWSAQADEQEVMEVALILNTSL